jgi:hypothetical protein
LLLDENEPPSTTMHSLCTSPEFQCTYKQTNANDKKAVSIKQISFGRAGGPLFVFHCARALSLRRADSRRAVNLDNRHNARASDSSHAERERERESCCVCERVRCKTLAAGGPAGWLISVSILNSAAPSFLSVYCRSAALFIHTWE